MKKLIFITLIVSNTAFAFDPCDPGSFTSDVDAPVKRLAKEICTDGEIKKEYSQAFSKVKSMCSTFTSCEPARLEMLSIAQTAVKGFAESKENAYLYTTDASKETSQTLLLRTHRLAQKTKEDNEKRKQAIKAAQKAKEKAQDAKEAAEKAKDTVAKLAPKYQASAKAVKAIADQALKAAKAEESRATQALKTARGEIEAARKALEDQERKDEVRAKELEEAAQIAQGLNKLHAKAQEKLDKKMSEYANCSGKSYTECAKIEPLFKTYLKKERDDLETLSDAYNELEEEIEKGDILSMMAKQEISQIDGVTKDIDEQFAKDKTFEQMDKTLLGKYIDEKAMAAVCAAKEAQTCNLATSDQSSVSNIQTLKTLIENKTREVRQAGSTGSTGQ